MEKELFSLKGTKYSKETVYSILFSLKETSSTFTTVAKQFRISRQECIKLFDNYLSTPSLPVLPEVLSFDEKYLNRSIGENGYVFVMVDWLNVKILDIVNSRHIDRLTSYFSKIPLEIRNKVKYITMDMYEAYYRLAKIYFPNAIVAIDSFHVLENLKRAFHKIRMKVMKKFDNGAEVLEDNDINYYLLKKYGDILYKNIGSLDTTSKFNKKLNYHISERGILSLILKIDEELKKAYNLLQKYLDFNRCKDRSEAEKEIDGLILDFGESKIASYIDFARTINTWKEGILNSFIRIYDENKGKYRRLSEGPIEGLNKIIMRVHINGNGFKSFKRLVKLLIYKINKYLPFKF